MPTPSTSAAYRTLCTIFFLILLSSISNAGAQNVEAPSTRAISRGAFTDRAGGKHDWSVNRSHALIWDGTPYLPVGVTFRAKSLGSPDGPDPNVAWAEDEAAITAFKKAGITDLIVHPSASLADVPAPAIQKLVDRLEGEGFHYGFAFGVGMNTPLTGLLVNPAAHKHDDPDSLTASWRLENADAALFLLVESADARIIPNRSGVMPVREGVVTVSTEASNATGRVVGYLYPRKSIPPAPGGLPDLWRGFDTYRDRLVVTLSGVKFGPGFRFFLDPLSEQLGMNGETDYLVPDSPAFQLEWEGFLTRRYPGAEEARQNWKLVDDTFKNFRDLARLVPLWAGKGVARMYDPAKGKFHDVSDIINSMWWSDFLAFRAESVQYYMNALANVLKRGVADVPVVYSWSGTNSIFQNREQEGGFDGLAVASQVGDRSALPYTLGPAYSQAELSARTIWCLASKVTEVPVTGSGPTLASVKPERDPRAALFATLGETRRVGYKGLFIAPAGADGLNRVRTYAEQVQSEGSAGVYAPRTLFFPQHAPGPARIGWVSEDDNVLWLNASAPGERLDWWPAFNGYTLNQPDGSLVAVVVSLSGPRKAHFLLRDPKKLEAFRANGDPVLVKVSRGNLAEVILDERPTLFRLKEPLTVPKEAVEDAIVQAGALLQKAEAIRIPGIEQERPSLEGALSAYRRGDFAAAFTFVRPTLGSLIYLAAPYIWLEGELPADEGRAHNFTEVVNNPAVANGQFLRLNTAYPAPRYTGNFYGARFEFNVVNEAEYDVWAAGSVPGPDVSPIIWKVDNGQDQAAVSLQTVGPLYANDRMGWVRLGRVKLDKGQHRLYIKVLEAAKATGRFTYSLDAVLLTPNRFIPNGRLLPIPLEDKSADGFRRDVRIPRN